MDNSFFEVEVTEIEQISSILLIGYLDAHTAPKLETAIRSVMDEGGKYILIDFEKLDYISSAGLGVFMAFIEELREINGDIKMCTMKPKIFSVFDLLGFPILFDIEHNRDAAIEKFNTIITQ